jgi:hypothetical protein
MKSSWIGIGFSHHSVPSLSNTATRSSVGTDAARATNSTMACLAGPSLQLESVLTPDTTSMLLVLILRKRGAGAGLDIAPIG